MAKNTYSVIMDGRRIHAKLRILKDPIRRSSVRSEKIFMGCWIIALYLFRRKED